MISFKGKVKIFTPIPLIDVYTRERDDIRDLRSSRSTRWGRSACILISRDKQISVYSRRRRVGISAVLLRGVRARDISCIVKGKPCLDRSHPLIVIFRLCDTCNPNDDLFITRFVRSDVDASLGFFRGFVSP